LRRQADVFVELDELANSIARMHQHAHPRPAAAGGNGNGDDVATGSR